MRDLAVRFQSDDPASAGCDQRNLGTQLRELPWAHPYAPHQLGIFNNAVHFITDPPGGCVKPRPLDADGRPKELTEEQKLPLARANAERMQQLVKDNGPNAIFIFTDGSRVEKQGSLVAEACAGAYIITVGPDPAVNPIRRFVAVSPIACVYSAELKAIGRSLKCLREEINGLVARGASRNVVIVTDSKSSLDAMKGTWLRRIGRYEQRVLSEINALVRERCVQRMTLAFVFSHVGGAPGNAAADALAEKARIDMGAIWTPDQWHGDTTRRLVQQQHDAASSALAIMHAAHFRFQHAPLKPDPNGRSTDTRGRPSVPLPPSLSREDETRLYRARLGAFSVAGGMLHTGLPDECPFCFAPALGPHGATMRHLGKCVSRHFPDLGLDAQALWTAPLDAAAKLAEWDKLVRFVKQHRTELRAEGEDHTPEQENTPSQSTHTTDSDESNTDGEIEGGQG